MSANKDNLLLLGRCGMELSWRYAWVVFLTLVLTQSIFPPLAAILVLALGTLTTHMSRCNNLRNYQILLLQTIGFALVCWSVLYWMQHQNSPVLSFEWTRHLFLESQTPPQWVILLPFFFYMWLFWNGGRLIAKGPRTYLQTGMQFDKGLGLFILLLVVYAFIDRRTDLNLQGRVVHYLILAFFVFSLVSIAVARGRSRIQKSYMAGYHGIGVILSTLSMVGFFGAGTTLLAYPFLYLKADSLFVALQEIAGPFKPFLIKLLIFLFHPRQVKLLADIQDENIPTIEEMGTPIVTGWQATLFKMLGMGLVGLMALVGSVVLAYAVIGLVRWLLKRDREKTVHLFPASQLRRFLKAFQAYLLRIGAKIMELVKGMNSAAMEYVRLLRWGRYSGLPPVSSDTPSEYGNRLMQSFPNLEKEIVMIVEAFNQEIYGQMMANKEALNQLVSAQRHMRRLRYWPSRIQAWLRH